jgi:uncharacterized protein (DUF983 family)
LFPFSADDVCWIKMLIVGVIVVGVIVVGVVSLGWFRWGDPVWSPFLLTETPTA